MKMKKLFAVVCCAAMAFSLAAAVPAEAAQITLFETPAEAVREVQLTGNGAEFSCGGVSVNGSTVTISAPGEYAVSGTLENGCIIVDTGASKEKVNITLKGVDITCLSGPALFVERADKVKLILADGTDNVLTSGTEETMASFQDDETRSGAAIDSDDDLTIKGSGSLTVKGYINSGITCKDDLKITGGTITLIAANNGMKGAQSIEVSDGTITITCGNDGLKTTSLAAGKGNVLVSDGKITVTSGGNGISASADIQVNGGEICLTSEKKPVKAGGTIAAKGGTITQNGEPYEA